jgi:hypothetical protein
MTSRWLLAGTLALAACTNSRQIVLSIDSLSGVPCDVDRIQIVTKAATTTTIDRSLKGVRLPISVTLLDDTPNGSFMLDVSGFKGDSEVMHVRGPLRFSGSKVTEAVMLDPQCTAATPCGLSDTSGASAGTRRQCGPDVTRYRAEPTVETFVNACTAAAVKTVPLDGGRAPVRLMDLENDMLPGFGFQFYGRPLREIWVSKDGYISFAQDSPDPEGALIPGPLDRDIKHSGEPPPSQSIMAFWDTLTLSSTGVCYELEGSPMNQRLHVTWSHACLTQPCVTSDQVNNLNFTITLDESTQRVVLTYDAMMAGAADRAKGATATVGLANDATGCPVEECVVATGLCKDGVTPCGYSQVFSNTVQMAGIQNLQFTPIIDR